MSTRMSIHMSIHMNAAPINTARLISTARAAEEGTVDHEELERLQAELSTKADENSALSDKLREV